MPNFLWAIGMLIASYALQVLLTPKPEKPKKAGLEDFDFPQVEEGTPQSVIFGDVWVSDWHVLWYGNLRTREIEKEDQTVGYRYYMSILMGLARGPVDEIVRINAADLQMWPIVDSNPDSGPGLMTIAEGPGGVGIEQYQNGGFTVVSGALINTARADGVYSIEASRLFNGSKGEGGIAGPLRVMMGASTQVVPSYIKTTMGGRVPDFRGVATAYFDGLICSVSPYPKKWEFRVRRTLQGWDGTVWQSALATVWMRDGTIKAMNGAHIIYECLTNREWGRGLPADAIDEASWLVAAQALYDEGLGLCLRYNRQSELSDFIQDVLDHIGGSLYPSKSTGKLSLSLLRSDYDPEDLDVYSYNTGLISLEDVETASQEDVVNEIIVKWMDPIGKNERSSRVQNLASRQSMGATNSATTSYIGIPEAALALRTCQRDLKASANSLKRYNLVLDRRAWTLVPGAVFRINVPERGIANAVLRAGKIAEAGGTDGKISVEAVLDVFGLPSASFIDTEPSAWVPATREAVIASTRVVREGSYAELARYLDPANLALLGTTTGLITSIVAKPSSLSLGYDIEILPPVGGVTTTPSAFAYHVITEALMPVTAAPFDVVITGTIDDDIVEIGTAVQINNEIGRLDALVVGVGTVTFTIARGCADTVPLSHAPGSVLYFLSEKLGGDKVEFDNAASVDAQILTFTSTAKLSNALAPTDTVVIAGRHGRPYPPANILVNGAHYSTMPVVSGDMTLSWVHRNRLTQKALLVSHNAASVPFEVGTTYTLRIYNGDTGSPVRTVAGLTGTSHLYTAAMMIEDVITADIWIEIEALRGGLVSHSKYRFGVTFDPLGYGVNGYGDAYGS